MDIPRSGLVLAPQEPLRRTPLRLEARVQGQIARRKAPSQPGLVTQAASGLGRGALKLAGGALKHGGKMGVNFARGLAQTDDPEAKKTASYHVGKWMRPSGAAATGTGAAVGGALAGPAGAAVGGAAGLALDKWRQRRAAAKQQQASQPQETPQQGSEPQQPQTPSGPPDSGVPDAGDPQAGAGAGGQTGSEAPQSLVQRLRARFGRGQQEPGHQAINSPEDFENLDPERKQAIADAVGDAQRAAERESQGAGVTDPSDPQHQARLQNRVERALGSLGVKAHPNAMQHLHQAGEVRRVERSAQQSAQRNREQQPQRDAERQQAAAQQQQQQQARLQKMKQVAAAGQQAVGSGADMERQRQQQSQQRQQAGQQAKLQDIAQGARVERLKGAKPQGQVKQQGVEGLPKQDPATIQKLKQDAAQHAKRQAAAGKSPFEGGQPSSEPQLQDPAPAPPPAPDPAAPPAPPPAPAPAPAAEAPKEKLKLKAQPKEQPKAAPQGQPQASGPAPAPKAALGPPTQEPAPAPAPSGGGGAAPSGGQQQQRGPGRPNVRGTKPIPKDAPVPSGYEVASGSPRGDVKYVKPKEGGAEKKEPAMAGSAKGESLDLVRSSRFRLNAPKLLVTT